MPGFSYGLPAEECITGSKLREIPGTVCFGCYAMKGTYKLWAYVVKPAQYKHLAAIEHPQWVDAMTVLIGRTKSKYFRWHDSGDLQSTEHLRRIAEIARRLPRVKFWLPTQEYQFVREYLRKGKPFPRNLVVRISAHLIDGPHADLGLPTSGVHSDKVPASCYECPSRYQDNQCGDCRACWTKTVKHVSYHEH